jgi:hypothetical protein
VAHNGAVNVSGEVATIASSLQELHTRISALVDNAGDDLASDVFAELVAVERTLGTAIRRLGRVTRHQ